MPWILIYAVVVNVLTALLAVWDKQQAKRDGLRVSERTLMMLAAAGGAAGLLFAMYTVRHKTRKPKFKYGVPCILLVQVALVTFLFIKGVFSV